MNELEKRNYTVAVDLGTTNVVVVVGARKMDGSAGYEFRKLVSKPVQAGGMQAGQIINKVAVGNSIRSALTEVEQDLGTRVSQVYTGLSGSFIRCENYTDHVFAQDSQGGISQYDVDALYARMKEVQAPDNEIIIDRIPQEFKIDDRPTDGDTLVGAFGRRLSATFQFVLCEKTPWERLHTLFDELGIKVLGAYPTMMSIVDSIATPEEREEGVAIINLGGDKTDLTVIHGNTQRYISSIPIGGADINDDLYSMGIPKNCVEEMKKQHGVAIAEKTSRKKLPIPGRRPNNADGILDSHLATAIEARLLDIIDCVKDELRDSGYGKRLGYGLILAGGGSRMPYIDELFRRETGLEVRLALTDQINRENNEPKSKPAYAAASGIFIRGVMDGRSEIMGVVRHRGEPVQEGGGKPQSGVQEGDVKPQSGAPATGPATKPETKPEIKSEKEPETKPEKEPETKPDTGQSDDEGGYGRSHKIKGSIPEEDFDNPEKELAGDDEPKGGFFSNLWNRIKHGVESSFDGDDDVSLGSGGGSEW